MEYNLEQNSSLGIRQWNIAFSWEKSLFSKGKDNFEVGLTLDITSVGKNVLSMHNV